MDFSAAQPPQTLSRPLQAMWWLKKGDFKMGAEWEQAHQLCQEDEGERTHDMVHALAHWIEGDMANRDYWYRRIQPWTRANTIPQEWKQLEQHLSGQ
ncbi:hypothetical protein [Aestuariivirga litoralis]|uniref:hypothetical protein n=1 Tax=Aestuariivirga litoralis TaxID=2650924 RepID=UPI0018C74021|nr:hypothetical protein [Aestuariivirga litoralis]MBG1231135.1 hypothetical protein [Aestuariivirga litoralis]